MMNHVPAISSEGTFMKSSFRLGTSQTRISSRQEQRSPEVSRDRVDQSPELTMKFSLLTTFSISCFVIVTHSLPINDQHGAAKFLKKFGYLNEANGYGGMTGGVIGADALSNALKDFQKFVGLKVTGKLDQDTVIKMNAPRWGVREIVDASESASRKRHILHGSKREMHLSYHVPKYPVKIRDRSKADEEMARAFKVWSDNTMVTFEERKTGQVNIDIRFDAGNYSDSDAFDGRGKTLAYSLLSRDGGGIHFHNDEEWTIDEGSGWISRPEDDLPDLCQDAQIDAITRTQSGATYVFKGNFYWEIHSDGGIVEGFPRRISDDWGGLEGNLDASFTWTDEKTYFFKRGRYWRFTGKKMDTGYPRSISAGFEGIPDDIDAVVVWNANGKPYFFKGVKFWRYDRGVNPPVDRAYPSNILEWKGVPDYVDAALRWDNSITYFFKGDKYYGYNDRISRVDSRYPLRTSERWFGCKSVPNNVRE